MDILTLNKHAAAAIELNEIKSISVYFISKQNVYIRIIINSIFVVFKNWYTLLLFAVLNSHNYMGHMHTHIGCASKNRYSEVRNYCESVYEIATL